MYWFKIDVMMTKERINKKNHELPRKVSGFPKNIVLLNCNVLIISYLCFWPVLWTYTTSSTSILHMFFDLQLTTLPH